jgi:tRNA A-37 threonylcarbamoyl transferase component Bud32
MRALETRASTSDREHAVAASPRRLGRYELRYEIANGGMATVYLAQLAGAQGFGKWVAIKWVHPHLAKDPRFVRMLIDEAKTTSQIDHPAVCQVLDFVEDEGTAYIVMEYLHGESLVSVLRRARDKGGLPISLAVRIAVQVARGLHAAHEARGADGAPLGVVHRDVSPQNIHVLYSGGAKVLDFGIALARDRLVEATAMDELKGKPAYMAPEQVLGGQHDRRADIWSLGIVLWEMLAQERLFRASSDAQTLLRVLNDVVSPPSKHRPEISPSLDAVVLRALDRDVGRRFATAAELADALESAMLEKKDVATESHVAAWMEDCHGEGRAMRESLLRARFSEGAGVLAIDLHRRSASTAAISSRGETVTLRARPGMRRTRAPAIAIATTAVLGAALAVLASGTTAAVPTAAVPTAAEPPTSIAVSSAPLAPPVAAVRAAPESVPLAERSATDAMATSPVTTVVVDLPERVEAPRRVPPPGRVNVLAVPAGEVYFHGQRLGSTPLVGSVLPAGRQRLEVRWGTVRRGVPVQVRSGELSTVTVRATEE